MTTQVVAMSNPQGINIEETVESSSWFPLRSNKYNFITIIGLNIQTTSLSFMDCRSSWENNPTGVQANFEYFYYNQSVLPDDIYLVQEGNIACPDQCAKCIKSNICIQCINGFLFNGQCLNECPLQALYADFKGVCTSTLPSSVALLNSSLTSTGASINAIVDQPDGTYLMILHASSYINFGNNPLTWTAYPYSLVESIPIIFNVINGSQSNTVTFKSIVDPSTTSSNAAQVVYYPIEVSLNDMNVYEWTNTNIVPVDSAIQSSPSRISTTTTKNHIYLDATSFYIFETLLNCINNCQITIMSDGTVSLVKNDRTVAFSLDFYTNWGYTFTRTFNGLMNLQFQISGATYFKVTINGTNYQTYRNKNPIGNYPLSLPQATLQCNIPNCNNCQGTICYSCNDGYFLSIDASQCLADCSPNKKLIAERICVSTCGGSTTDDGNGSCYPSCNTPGMFYTQGSGCNICVDGCNICSGPNTCAQCLFPTSSDNGIACPRKSGDIFTTQNFNISQTIYLSANSGQNYAIIVSDYSTFMDNGVYFMNPQSQNPRILGIYGMTTVSNAQQQAILQPLSIPQSGNISLHYIKLLPDSSPSNANFSLTGFYAQSYLDWPTYEDVPLVDFNNGYLNYGSINGLFQAAELYETVIAQKVFTHDSTSPIQCQASIQYQGSIRGFYVNSKLIFFDSTVENNISTQQILTQTVNFDPSEYFLITITGYNFEVSSLSFVSCINAQSQSVAPKFSSFVLNGLEANSDTFYVMSNTACSQNCDTCSSKTQCIKCSSDFYLQEDGSCSNQCSGNYQFASLFGFCDTTMRKQGYAIGAATYLMNEGVVTAQYNLVLEFSTTIITVAFPFTTTFGKFPGILAASTQSTLAEATYEIIAYSQGDNNITLQLPVKNSASSYLEANIVLYTIKMNYILIVSWTGAYPNIDQPNPSKFRYININSNSFGLVKSNTYSINFFVNCSTSCNIVFSTDGFITIKGNYATFLFNATFDSTFPAYTLQKPLTGITFLEIFVWNATNFAFQVQGNSQVFSYDQFILSDKTNLTSTNPVQVTV